MQQRTGRQGNMGLINNKTLETQGSVRLVDRVLDLLTSLERVEQPIGLSDISRVIGLHKATVQRLLNALERRGFVQKERGLYQLGSAIVPLARAFLSGNNLTKSALPVLEELVAITGETASIYVRQESERVLIQRVESPSPLRFVVRIGERLPIYSGASGQVLCANIPEQELKQLLDRVGQIQLANGKVLNKKEMHTRLAQVKQQGFASCIDERLVGLSSVAAPIVHRDMSIIAAVVVTGPSSRVTLEKIQNLSNEVRRAAREIAERYCRG